MMVYSPMFLRHTNSANSLDMGAVMQQEAGEQHHHNRPIETRGPIKFQKMFFIDKLKGWGLVKG